MAEEQEAEPLSPTQIHQKVILVLSNFHKTTLNAGRGHEASRKAAHSLQKEVGQNIRDKKRDKSVRYEDPFQGGSPAGGEVSKRQETLSPEGLWGSFVISEGNITGRRNTHTHTHTHTHRIHR